MNKPWNKGIKVDRKKYPNMGHYKKHTKESIEKQKLSFQKTKENGYISPKKNKTLEQIHGIKKAKEIKNKISKTVSKTLKDQYISGERAPIIHTKETKNKIKQARLKQVFPVKDTRIEVMIQKGLTKADIVFEKHKPILGQPDIFIEPNICIFVDGCYWHCCHNCYPDRNKHTSHQRGKVVKDTIITQYLISKDYIVLRFWEHEIKKDVEKVINEIKSKIEVESNVRV